MLRKAFIAYARTEARIQRAAAPTLLGRVNNEVATAKRIWRHEIRVVRMWAHSYCLAYTLV